MTNEEAIKHLNFNEIYTRDWKEAILMAKEALERQIPDLPYLDKPGGVEDWFFCPNCNHNDVEYKDKYCRRCGQALDWRK